MGRFLKIKSYEIEHISGDDYILVNPINRKRIQLNKHAYRFFFEDRQVLEEEEVNQYKADQNFAKLFDLLTKSGFYIPEEKSLLQIIKNDLIIKANPTFCFSPSGDYKTFSDFGILGFPYSMNQNEDQSVRTSPDVIRTVSTKIKYSIDPHQRIPSGTFSLYDNQWLLKGATIQDFGNIHVRPGENSRSISRKSASILREVKKYCKIPVILGGDHTVTYYVLYGLQQEKQLQVVYFDAHLDDSVFVDKFEIYHGNVISAILNLTNIHSVVNIGARGFHKTKPDGRITIIPSGNPIDSMLDQLLNNLNTEIPLYLSIDLDAFDPPLMNCVYFPEPFGLRYDTFLAILERLAGRFSIVGCDFVEYVPKKDINKMYANLLLYLIIKTMDILKGAK